MNNKDEMLDKIGANIAKYGHHVHIVAGGANPRFAYSIGLSQRIGVELVFAGASFYTNNEVRDIINDVAGEVEKIEAGHRFEFVSSGRLTLGRVDDSWASKLILGALDYYKKSKIGALQIIPDAQHWTIDVPNLSTQWSAAVEPIWQWLGNPWGYPISKRSIAVTNLDALRGKPITEAMRWDPQRQLSLPTDDNYTSLFLTGDL